MNNQNLYPRTKHALSAIRSSTHTHTHPRNHPPTHTTAMIKDNETLRSTKALHSVEKEHQQHTFPSRGRPSRCSSVSAFLCLGAIRLRDIRLGAIRLGDIRLGGIRLGFPQSRGHPSRLSSVSGASVSGASVFETTKVQTNGTDGYPGDGKTWRRRVHPFQLSVSGASASTFRLCHPSPAIQLKEMYFSVPQTANRLTTKRLAI